MQNTVVSGISSTDVLFLVNVVAIALVVIPFRAFKALVTDCKRCNPPKKRDTCKETPRKCLPLGLYPCRQSEEPTGQKRPDAAAGR
jgi:hypothetical protein